MNSPLTILHLEEDAAFSLYVQSYLEQANITANFIRVNDREGFTRSIQQDQFDIIFADYMLLPFNGLEALVLAQEHCPRIPFIFITETLGEELAVDTMLNGAIDYILKNNLKRLIPAIKRVIGDIDEYKKRQKAEREVAESEIRFRTVIDLLPHFIQAKDEQGKFILLNRACAAAFGMTPQELVGKSIRTLCEDEDEALQYIQDDHEVIQSNQTKFIPYETFTGSDGKTVILQTTKIPFRTLQNQKAVLGISVDITEQLQLETSLKEYKDKLSFTLQESEIGIWEWDIKTKHTTWDETSHILYGYKPDEFSGEFQDFLKCIHPDDRVGLQLEFEGCLQQKTGIRTEFRAVWHDGSIHWIGSRGKVIVDEEGNPVRMMGVNIDITEKKKREEELHLLFHALEQCSVAIVITNADGLIEYVNPAFSSITGYSTKEALNKNPNILKSNVHSNEFYQELWDTLKSGKIWKGQICNKKKDGSLFWESASISPVMDKNGVIQYYIAVKEDITQRRQLEEAYQVLVNQTIQGLLIMQDGRIVFGNERLAEITGYSLHDLYQMDYHEILLTIHHEDRTLIKEQIEKRLRGESVPVYYEFRSIDKNGDITWLQACSNLITYQGKTAIQTSIIDITESKHLEEAYQVLVNQSIQGLVIFQDNRLVFANTRFSELSGYSMDELYAMTQEDYMQTVHPEDRNEIIQRHVKRMKGEMVPNSYVFRGIRKNGEICWVQTHTCLITYEGKPAVQMAMIDITESKKLEDQLHQAQKMESIGHLAGGVAHDFNNILLAIKLNTEFALDAVEEGSQIRDDLAEVLNAAMRAESLTRQLLIFSRKQVVEPQIINLNSIAENLEKMLRRLIGENINLFINLDPALGNVKADEGQIEQIIMNLLVNARDAMPNGGTITIETQNVQLDELYTNEHPEISPGSYIMFAISDTGSGIPREIINQIFEPFFTTKSKGKGTGLGLSTVYGIVKQNGGSIHVYSELNYGTTFRIYLPRIDEEFQHIASFMIDQPHKGAGTILVVEDDESVRFAIARILEQNGYTVYKARNGLEALQLCNQFTEPVQLLLTDVIMPNMNGIDLAEEIKLIFPNTKVLFMSGYTDNAIIHQRVFEQGMNYLQKPVSGANLLTKVIQLMDKVQ